VLCGDCLGHDCLLSGAAASAACPVVYVGSGIGGDHAGERLRFGHGAVTGR
jgi:hypothetical protein